MMNYSEIQKLFGTPLMHLAKPHIPYKLKTGHVVIGLVVFGLAAYGGYKIYEGLKNRYDGDDND